MTTTTEQHIEDHLTRLRLIQSDHATYEQVVHEAALNTRDDNPLIVAQQLGEYLGHAVNVDTLCDLAENLVTVECGLYSGLSEGEWHRRRVEDLTRSILLEVAS